MIFQELFVIYSSSIPNIWKSAAPQGLRHKGYSVSVFAAGVCFLNREIDRAILAGITSLGKMHGTEHQRTEHQRTERYEYLVSRPSSILPVKPTAWNSPSLRAIFQPVLVGGCVSMKPAMRLVAPPWSLVPELWKIAVTKTLGAKS